MTIKSSAALSMFMSTVLGERWAFSQIRRFSNQGGPTCHFTPNPIFHSPISAGKWQVGPKVKWQVGLPWLENLRIWLNDHLSPKIVDMNIESAALLLIERTYIVRYHSLLFACNLCWPLFHLPQLPYVAGNQVYHIT